MLKWIGGIKFQRVPPNWSGFWGGCSLTFFIHTPLRLWRQNLIMSVSQERNFTSMSCKHRGSLEWIINWCWKERVLSAEVITYWCEELVLINICWKTLPRRHQVDILWLIIPYKGSHSTTRKLCILVKNAPNSWVCWVLLPLHLMTFLQLFQIFDGWTSICATDVTLVDGY